MVLLTTKYFCMQGIVHTSNVQCMYTLDHHAVQKDFFTLSCKNGEYNKNSLQVVNLVVDVLKIEDHRTVCPRTLLPFVRAPALHDAGREAVMENVKQAVQGK